MADMFDDATIIFYVVRVGGSTVTPPLGSRALAEGERMKLPVQQQAIAEVVPITADGKQVLFG